MDKRSLKILLFASLLLVALFVLSILIGPSGSSILDPAIMRVILYLRLPRTLLALFAGAYLALSGSVYQAILMNPLASPYTVGVAGGAALGAIISAWLGLPILLHFIVVFLMGLVVSSSVIVIWRKFGQGAPNTFILAGVMAAFFFSSCTILFNYLIGYRTSTYFMKWILGSVLTVGMNRVLPFVFILPFAIYLLKHSLTLDLMCFGKEFALSKGVDYEKNIERFSFINTVIVAAVVAGCGPIGFVGLVVPHIARTIVGTPHRFQLPLSMILGGGFVVFVDLVQRIVTPEVEVPAGIGTALVGAPFFIYLILKKMR